MTDTREFFDLYDADGHPLGRAKPRDEVHRDGDWHRSAHIWIFTGDARVLLQRRAPDKDTWPGRFDASIGGHYRAGEGAESVVREAREELGIDVDPNALILLGARRVESAETAIIDREIQDIYALRCDLPLTAYTPQRAEIDALALANAGEAARLHAGALDRLTAVILPIDADAPVAAELTADDLIPGRGRYLEAVARAVADLLGGRTPPVVSME